MTTIGSYKRNALKLPDRWSGAFSCPVSTTHYLPCVGISQVALLLPDVTQWISFDVVLSPRDLFINDHVTLLRLSSTTMNYVLFLSRLFRLDRRLCLVPYVTYQRRRVRRRVNINSTQRSTRVIRQGLQIRLARLFNRTNARRPRYNIQNSSKVMISNRRRIIIFGRIPFSIISRIIYLRQILLNKRLRVRKNRLISQTMIIRRRVVRPRRTKVKRRLLLSIIRRVLTKTFTRRQTRHVRRGTPTKSRSRHHRTCARRTIRRVPTNRTTRRHHGRRHTNTRRVITTINDDNGRNLKTSSTPSNTIRTTRPRLSRSKYSRRNRHRPTRRRQNKIRRLSREFLRRQGTSTRGNRTSCRPHRVFVPNVTRKVLYIQNLTNRLRTRRASRIKQNVQRIIRNVYRSNGKTRRDTCNRLTRARRRITYRTRPTNGITMNNTRLEILHVIKLTSRGAGRGLDRGNPP